MSPFISPSEQEYRSRPYIADFESGIDAALLSLYRGWYDGVNGLMNTPRIAYERHGQWGGVAGTAIAVVNTLVKPFVGTLSSITWFCRGLYASAYEMILTDGDEEEILIENTLNVDVADLEGSPQELIQAASEVSKYSVEICEQILTQFDQIKERSGSIRT